MRYFSPLSSVLGQDFFSFLGSLALWCFCLLWIFVFLFTVVSKGLEQCAWLIVGLKYFLNEKIKGLLFWSGHLCYSSAFLLTKYIVRFSYYPLEFASSTGLCIIDGVIYSYSCAFVMVRRKELIDWETV